MTLSRQDFYLKKKKKKITQFDIVICIAASGNTIFTNEILELCKQKKVKTIAISNNPKGKILKKQTIKSF